MLVCGATGGEIDTHTRYSQDDLGRTKAAKLLLRCPHCDKSHVFYFSDARLKSIGTRRDGKTH